jgi:hypothetical protein
MLRGQTVARVDHVLDKGDCLEASRGHRQLAPEAAAIVDGRSGTRCTLSLPSITAIPNQECRYHAR